MLIISKAGPNRRLPRRGGAAAELAIILPVLMTLVLGAVDFSRFAYYYIAVTNAARAGSAYACMNNFTSSSSTTWQSNISSAAQDEMRNQVGAGNISNLTVTTTTTTDANGLKRAQVTASYPFTTIINWQWTGLGIPHTMTLARKVELRLIR